MLVDRFHVKIIFPFDFYIKIPAFVIVLKIKKIVITSID